MVVAAHRHGRGPDLIGLIDTERHSYGRSFLSGDEGGRSEAAFHAFADVVARDPAKT